MSTETPSPQDRTQGMSPSSSPRTPLTNHLLEVMDSKPVPVGTLDEIRRHVANLPDIANWHQLKRWFHDNRPKGVWTIARIFEAQKMHHAEYLDKALEDWAGANGANSKMPPRGTSSRKAGETVLLNSDRSIEG